MLVNKFYELWWGFSLTMPLHFCSSLARFGRLVDPGGGGVLLLYRAGSREHHVLYETGSVEIMLSTTELAGVM